MKLRFLVVSVLLVLPAAAQDRVADHNFHGWLAYFGDHPVAANSRWGVHLEAQVRRRDAVNEWQQLLIRPGVNYQLTGKTMLTGGYAFVRSPGGVHEHRLWEQAWIRYKTGKVGWNTRLRFENRFLDNGAGFRYENRFRAWQQIRVPLAPKKYFTAYDEFWVYVRPYRSNSWFDQNRAYAAMGFEISRTFRIEAGYLQQTILSRDSRKLDLNHTMIVSFFSTAPLFGRR